MTKNKPIADQATPLPISENDQRDVEKLYEAFRSGKAKLVGPDGQGRQLPASLYAFLVELIGALQLGKCVYILQNQARLTTAEAAGMLGVSRQFLVNLLNSGDIPHHMVGTHRRIYVADLMKYKAKRDGLRKRALNDLIRYEVQEGLYDKVPPSK
jgi:excisionase family DNA binding protein